MTVSCLIGVAREEIESLCRVYRKLVATSHAHNSGAAAHSGNPAAAVLPSPNSALITEVATRNIHITIKNRRRSVWLHCRPQKNGTLVS